VILIALLFAAGNDLDRIFNLWLALVPLLFLPALAVTVYWIVALVRNLWCRRWRRVASIIAAPIAVWLIFAGARSVGITPELIRFEIEKRHYVEQVEKLARTGEPRLALFDWGQIGGAGTANLIYTLVSMKPMKLHWGSSGVQKDGRTERGGRAHRCVCCSNPRRIFRSTSGSLMATST
jgi:hypothetical protein